MLHLTQLPRTCSLVLFALLVSFCLLSCASGSTEQQGQTLFEPNTDDWMINGDANWDYIDDQWIARLDSGTGFVMTKGMFEDFELTLDFYPDSTVNSGIYIRCKDAMISASDCYELNIWDLHPNQDNRTGAVVARAKPLKYVETLNQWNSYRISVKGDHLQAWVNDQQTADLHNSDLATGYLALQAAMGGEVRFRNVRLTKL
ncbi:MAG: DUF1080 domain-containing protein [Cyclobacteriaceae bacterium]